LTFVTHLACYLFFARKKLRKLEERIGVIE
jgi:hypothetical protein